MTEIARPATSGRRVVMIVGSGRSGTSVMACTLQQLGMRVPQPEVPADETNPKGFGESQWLVDFHDRLLQRANVTVSDARPRAWFSTSKQSTHERFRRQASMWLERQFEEADEVVLKDPRLVWFLGLWESAALHLGVTPVFISMLRPPAEVIGSKHHHYSSRVSLESRAASWVNLVLHTERATRGKARAFVRYHDLLSDWTVPVHRLGEDFALDAVLSASAKDLRGVYDLIDPSLYRVRSADLEVPIRGRLKVLMDGTQELAERLADGKDDAEAHAASDELRADYLDLYEQAEAIADSTTQAVGRKLRKRHARTIEQAVAEALEARSESAATAEPLTRRQRNLLRRGN
ncbi:sulfotransferase family protein [Nocardioides soli]|uniref:Sulfotransferase family protein n=1 Tax=Nocardioides soli TaxID=1036020 RepID=A0A7W4Z1T4_9ACTN|nr:sulfotransferase family protein [Nocardioides soli]MBB3042196.1 hypothetical protein [Nocardioides soli]